MSTQFPIQKKQSFPEMNVNHNSESNASELPENIGDTFNRYW